MGSVCVLTQYNYCGNHSYCDHWATRTTQINGCTGLVPEVLWCIERDIIAAFLLHQGYPLVQGLIVVMTLLVTIVVVILML